jgi:trigger factor
MSEKDLNENTESTEAGAVETQEDAHDHEHGHDHDHDHGDEHQEEEFKFEEDPAFEIDYKGDCAYEVKVTIPAVNTQAQTVKLLDELQEEAELPGFRKGRAPRKLLEKKFSKIIRGDATDKLVNAAFMKLIKEKDLKPLAAPKVDGLEKLTELKEGDPIVCTFSFEVFAKCELGKYRGVEVERPVLLINDKDVADSLDDLRSRFAVYEPVEDGEAQDADQVIIDFTGTIDGETFQGGSAQNYPYILGSKRFFSQFEDTLLGAKTGQELSCEVPFPADYSSANLAGKTAQFTIKVLEIKRKQLPELDDDFAKQVGHETAAALRESITKRLQDNAKQQCDSIAEFRALKQIIADSTFEVPKSMLKSMTESAYERETNRLKELRVPGSDIAAREEELLAQAQANALDTIRNYVVIREIVEAEGLEVTEEDFEKEAEAISGRLGMNMATVSQFIKTDERRSEYEDQILRRKALDVVLANAAITEKETSLEELEKENEDAES